MDDSYFLELENGRVFVTVRGQGEALLFALHGYGDQSLMFERLTPELCGNRRVVAIDLPGHGRTEWRATDFGPAELCQIVVQLMHKYGVSDISFLGFSMGARLIMNILPKCSFSVQELILLAPDGIQSRGMGLVSFLPVSWRKWMVTRIKGSSTLTQWLLHLGKQTWLPETIRFFTSRHFKNQSKLELALAWWLILARFPVEKQKMRKWAATTQIPIQVWIGENDPLLKVQDIHAFWGSFSHLELKVIPGAGHVVGFQRR